MKEEKSSIKGPLITLHDENGKEIASRIFYYKDTEEDFKKWLNSFTSVKEVVITPSDYFNNIKL